MVLFMTALCCNTGAAGYYGGAASGVTMYNSLVISNVCHNRGGGVSGSTLYNCLLLGNIGSASGYGAGGGAYSSTLYNSLLVGNMIPANRKNNGGGAADSLLINCTIVNNDCGGGLGGGVYNSRLTNSSSWNNSKPDVDHLAWYSCGLNYTNGGTIVGNLDVDPKLLQAVPGVYRLRGNSPCINAGLNLDWMTNVALVISRDLAGDVRLRDGTVDMGAFEYLAASTLFLIR